ncbi:MAG TPA: translation elongation factor Ts [Candidatus Onthovivens sp.]|nr:translation elongation factor Ts [Candidatus Onthovivens sp.]
MANIELIKILRDRTGAGMMDCKNALDAAENDVDKAIAWLREKGISKQANKASRIAAEGLCQINICEACNSGIISELNCETDFVAKSDDFANLINLTNQIILKNKIESVEKAIAHPEVVEAFTNATVKLGEKLSLRRFEIISKTAENGFGRYIHLGGKIGVIIVLEKADEELAKGLAMHIAANAPKYITTEEISSQAREEERHIQLEAAKNDEKLKSKPEAALEKIIEGKLNKVFGEFTLTEQEFLLEPGKTIATVLKEKGNRVLKFVRYNVGEGLEKRKDNFAEEVMAQANN